MKSLTYDMSRSDVENAGKSGATKKNVARILNGPFLYTNLYEQSVGRWLSNDGFWEAWVTSWFTKNIKPGFVCVDVGANYGYYTRIMEQLATSSGHVHAIEANPRLCDAISNSIRDYPIENSAIVSIYNAAATDFKGSVMLHIPPNFIGGSSIVWKSEPLPSNIPDKEWSMEMKVNADTIDNLLSDVDHIDLMKMDIEGAEPQAWRGMQSIVTKTDVIVMEIGPYLDHNFIDELYAKYDVYIIEGDGSDRNIERPEFDKLTDLIMGVLRRK